MNRERITLTRGFSTRPAYAVASGLSAKVMALITDKQPTHIQAAAYEAVCQKLAKEIDKIMSS